MIIELKSLDEIDPCEFAYYANDPNINTYLRNSFPAPYIRSCFIFYYSFFTTSCFRFCNCC